MTVLPAAGADYPQEEFIADLLRLDRQPDATDSHGRGFELSGSTGRKGGKRLTLFDETGEQHDYSLSASSWNRPMDVLTTPPLPLAEWLSVVEREYLSEYVPSGGAAVKLAILDDDAIGTAAEPLVRLGRAYAMLAVQVDAGRTRDPSNA